MKYYLITVLTTIAFASSSHSIEFNTAYWAQGVGYDCGNFEDLPVPAPEIYTQKEVKFKKLSADKPLNNFMLELSYKGAHEVTCEQTNLYVRNRMTQKLELTHTEVNLPEFCGPTKSWLDEELKNPAYDATPRGHRYLAINIIDGQENEYCEGPVVRAIFERKQ